MPPIRVEIEEIARACAEKAGVYILDIKTQLYKNKMVIDISADAGRVLTIDDYAVLSRDIDSGIRERLPDFELYDLRVGSPGIERPLEHRWQFEKNVGRVLRFILAENGKERSMEMRLQSVGQDTLKFADSKGTIVEYPTSAVHNAVVQIEF